MTVTARRLILGREQFCLYFSPLHSLVADSDSAMEFNPISSRWQELMDKSKLRRQIAWEAARLMYQRQESEYYRAKLKAARRMCRGWVKPADLPSNAEIRDQDPTAGPTPRRRFPHRSAARHAAGSLCG